MLRIGICDDESALREMLAGLVSAWASSRGLAHQTQRFASGESVLFAYDGALALDILLLDIQMQGIDGVSLARKLRMKNDTVQLIFITGFPDFIAEGYDVSALHYLLKPVDKAKLFKVLDKAVSLLQAKPAVLPVQTATALEKVPMGDILSVESFGHNVAIRTKTGVLETRAVIGELEKTLAGVCVRCHRSYLAGLAHIRRITKNEVVLDGDLAIPLSRRLYAAVNLAFIQFHKGES